MAARRGAKHVYKLRSHNVRIGTQGLTFNQSVANLHHDKGFSMPRQDSVAQNMPCHGWRCIWIHFEGTCEAQGHTAMRIYVCHVARNNAPPLWLATVHSCTER